MNPKLRRNLHKTSGPVFDILIQNCEEIFTKRQNQFLKIHASVSQQVLPLRENAHRVRGKDFFSVSDSNVRCVLYSQGNELNPIKTKNSQIIMKICFF